MVAQDRFVAVRKNVKDYVFAGTDIPIYSLMSRGM
jgi:hypothetical protein